MTTEDKFHAAVEVVNSIPDDGTFEPSNEIMLKFYAYYKQATEGPCREPKPYIWNSISRNKWIAWNELGDMLADTAMENYIEELTKVVETMSHNEKIAKFLSLMGSFYELVSSEENSHTNQSSQGEKWSDEINAASIFKKYDSPTISDLYHIAKKECIHSPKTIETNEVDNRYLIPGGLNQNVHISKSNCYESHSRVYSQSSLSTSPSSSSDISNFEIISNSSGDESNVIVERENLHLLNSNQNVSACELLSKKDILIFTFINLQNSMQDILEKFENLNSLAEKQNRENNHTDRIQSSITEWGLNVTTTVILLWPIVVGTVFG